MEVVNQYGIRFCNILRGCGPVHAEGLAYGRGATKSLRPLWALVQRRVGAALSAPGRYPVLRQHNMLFLLQTL